MERRPMTEEEAKEMKSPARVQMHLPGGYTKLFIETWGMIPYDVLTERIPPHLRALGTRVHLVFRRNKEYELIGIEDLPDELYERLYGEPS
jgi:hypothetical protein